MTRIVLMSCLAMFLAAGPMQGASITGKYVEARTCDVWTAPCFANAEMNLTGKHGVLAWKVEKGTLENVKLDGLSVVAVVAASDTLGLKQTGPGKAVILYDDRANDAQRDALVQLAKKQGGDLVRNVVAVQAVSIDLSVCQCKEGACARLHAGDKARIETRCIDVIHDKTCGNEGAFYPPLAKGVQARPAVALEHSFSGKDFNQTWKDSDRRGAYVGTFEFNGRK